MGTGRHRRTLSRDNALLGTLALQLARDDLGAGLEAAADLLRDAADADGCEIFLTEPGGADLLMSAVSGSESDALATRTRFGPGSGYPGLAGSGETVSTRHLDGDRRFLRRAVARRGIQCFLTVPLDGACGRLGCMSLAWQDGETDIESAAAMLARAAGPICAAVGASLLAARERMDRAVNAVGADSAARARACLETIAQAAGARAGTLVLYQSGQTSVLSAGEHAAICPGAMDGRKRCTIMEEGHGIVLTTSRARWPDPCRCLPSGIERHVCLPLRAHGRLHGMVVLDLNDPVPQAPGRLLAPLLAMASAAAAWLAPRESGVPAARAAALPTADPVLQLRCLGGFDVSLGGRLVPAEAFTRRKALTLLKLLVVSAGNPVNRDALAEHLWPGVDGPAGANRVYGVLHALRNAIEPFREQRRWIYVCHTGDLYYFNMESPHRIDLFEFRRHAAAADEARRRGATAESLGHVEQALALYQGDLFADEPYAGWCELERAELRHRYLELARRGAELCAATGDSDRAIGWLRQALRVESSREDLHRLLIGELVALGRLREAREQYQTCVRVLRDELGLEPSAELRSVAPPA